MNSLEIIQNLYHPYKVTLKNNVQIIDCTDGRYVLKKEHNDLFTLYSYLNSRGINSYPKLIRNFNEEDNLEEYISSIELPKEQYFEEMAKELALIHSKTVYQKLVDEDQIKEIKENINSNITYLNNKYQKLIKSLLLKNFLTPIEYYFVRNYYKIQNALDFCTLELEEWDALVKDRKNVRICLLHNNLSLEHFIVSQNKNAFISWDHYRFDMPLLDIVQLFINVDFDNNFSSFLDTYFHYFSYEDYELKLLFILLSIPNNIDLDNDYNSIIRSIKKVDSIENLIRPYYLKDEKE